MRFTSVALTSLLVTLACWAGEARSQDEIAAVIPFTTTPPVIDGQGTEFDPVWEQIEGIYQHDFDEFNTVVGVEPDEGGDLLPTWKALWDVDNLYVLIEVVDIDIHNTGECNWDDDSVEVYIDAQDINSENFEFGNNPPDGVPAYQFTAIAGDAAGGPFCNPANERSDPHAFTLGINSFDGPDNGTRYPQDEGMSTGSQAGDVFYTFEAAFPWDALEANVGDILSRGSFGFGVAINDDDTNGSRETQLMWASESPDLWMRSDVFPSVALGEPPPPGTPCDFDENGACDIDDINQLMNDAETGGTSTDLNNDGVVNDMDRDEWLALAGPENGFSDSFLAGDSDLNGTVDAGDLNNLALAWQDPTKFNWSDGNFTIAAGPGVLVSDLNVLAVGWQQTVPLAAAAEAVPEPTTPCWLFLGLLCVLRRNWQPRR